MKKTLLFSYILVIFVVFSGKGQLLSQPVAFERKAYPVAYYLNTLKEKGFKISYIPNHIDLEQLIILNKTKSSLGVILKDILREQPVELAEKNGRIFITRMQNIPPKKKIKGDKTIYIFCSDLRNPYKCGKVGY